MYRFPEEKRRIYEEMVSPIAIYQYLDGKVITLLVSDGFCEMKKTSREKIVRLLDDSMFDAVHPEDAGRLASLGDAFARKQSPYDVVYRTRLGEGGDYAIMHTIGKWVTMEDGTDLAFLFYTNMTSSLKAAGDLVGEYFQFRRDQFYFDPVTGLLNLNYLNQFAQEKVHKLRTVGKEPAVVYFDVKAMNVYNSHYGFEQGDALLKMVAGILKESFSDPDDLVTRGPDDHFIVLTSVSSEEALVAMITGINRRVRSETDGAAAGIQAGICRPGTDCAAMDAVSRAKHALRDIGDDINVVSRFFSYETEARYWEERYILENLAPALEKGWIRAYYQPIMRTGDGRLCHLEALARWEDPVRGLLPPADFIPVLKKYHLLYQLDVFMVREVCREVFSGKNAGLNTLSVSVNFSAQDFDHIDVLSVLNHEMGKCGAERRRLIVEITEQEVAAARENFARQLHRIRESGYELWVDDFGSGYSSLNVFSRFQFDRIKFDLELLRNLDYNNGANRHIMRGMTEVAGRLKIHTLAEGVEDEKKLDFLRSIGCGMAQGYYFSRPLPLPELLKLKEEKGWLCQDGGSGDSEA